MSNLDELRDYTRDHYPDLYQSIKYFQIYEAVCATCRHFNLRRPELGDNIEDASAEILAGIKKFEEESK